MRGGEYPPGWTIADFNLVRGDWQGVEYAYELWVVPLIEGEVAHPGGEARPPG